MNDERNPVRLSLAGEVTYTKDISVGQAAQIISFIHGQGSAGAVDSGQGRRHDPGRLGAGVGGVTSDPRQALEASGAKTNPEKLVALALYLCQQGGQDTFKLDEITPLFQRAREAAPKNPSRDLGVAIKSGWIAESDISGVYYVTDRASQVLSAGFDAIRQSRGTGAWARPSGRRTRASGRPTGASGSSIPDVLVDVEVVPTLNGFINYHKVKQWRDKLLWAVNYAKVNGVADLSNQDVVWLTDQLGDGIAMKYVSSYFQANRRDGYLNRNNQGRIRILPTGIEHLQGLEPQAAK